MSAAPLHRPVKPGCRQLQNGALSMRVSPHERLGAADGGESLRRRASTSADRPDWPPASARYCPSRSDHTPGVGPAATRALLQRVDTRRQTGHRLRAFRPGAIWFPPRARCRVRPVPQASLTPTRDTPGASDTKSRTAEPGSTEPASSLTGGLTLRPTPSCRGVPLEQTSPAAHELPPVVCLRKKKYSLCPTSGRSHPPFSQFCLVVPGWPAHTFEASLTSGDTSRPLFWLRQYPAILTRNP